MGVETQASSRPGIRLHCGSGSEDLEQRLVALLEQEFERQQPVRPMRVVRLLVPSAAASQAKASWAAPSLSMAQG